MLVVVSWSVVLADAIDTKQRTKESLIKIADRHQNVDTDTNGGRLARVFLRSIHCVLHVNRMVF